MLWVYRRCLDLDKGPVVGSTDRRDLWTSLAAGLTLGFVVVGLPVGRGLLANLDLVAAGTIDIDPSFWGSTVGLPRRAPLTILLALVSPPLSAATATRLWMILIVAGAFVGMVRYLRPARSVLRYSGALLYAASPFLLTRLAVGHLGFATAVALLPWGIGPLLAYRSEPRAAFGHLTMFGLCGYFGMIVAGPVLLAALLAERHLPSPRQVAAMVYSQLPWLLPWGILITRAGTAGGRASAAAFPTRIDDPGDALRLVIGDGFWRPENQLGSQHLVVAVLCGVLILLAVFGSTLRPVGQAGPFGSLGAMGRVGAMGVVGDRTSIIGLGLIGAIVGISSSIPVLGNFWDWLTSWFVAAPLRESHRLLIFVLFGVIVLAVAAGDRLADVYGLRFAVAIGFVLAALAISGAGSGWGLDGAARGHVLPPSWAEAKAKVEASDDRSVLALPFVRYFGVDAAGGVRAHHPVPVLISGEILFSHDLGLESAGTEQWDDRELEADLAVRALRLGVDDATDRLQALGVHWIVALPDLDGGRDIELLQTTGFERVVHTPEVSVFRLDSATANSGTYRSIMALVALMFWVIAPMLYMRRLRCSLYRYGWKKTFSCLWSASTTPRSGHSRKSGRSADGRR